MFYSFLYRAHLVQITIRLTILLTTFRQIYEQISTWVVVIRSVYARVENLTVLSPFSAACHVFTTFRQRASLCQTGVQLPCSQ